MSAADSLLSLAIVGGLAWYFFGGSGDKPAEPTSPQPNVVTQVAAPAVPATAPVARRWDESEICGYGIQAYFMVTFPPRYVDWRGRTHIFRTQAGNTYECRVVGDRIHLDWVNATGQFMQSKNTRYRLDGSSRIHVTTDMMETTFSR